ncbi:MAG: xanthine dehydrogenase family protein molybdopterin-binding subunit [Anaerolineae bacterium]
MPKLDALDKATGRAIYGHDLTLPGMLHGKILWSEHPFARILSVDTRRAARLPGVKAVLTGADNPGGRFGYGKDNVPLKQDVVRWYGDAVAAVAAIDEDTASEALSLIEVEYEPLPPVFDPEAALQPEAPLIHDWRDSNLFNRFVYSHGDEPVEAALDRADVVVEDEFELPYVTHACMEPSFAMAAFDLQGRLTLYSTTQIPFLLQKDLTEALGIPGRDIRIVQTAIGGAFGRGLDIYPFEPVSAMLAKASGRPVRIAFNRFEEFFATPVRQPMKTTIRTGVSRDGSLLVRDVEGILDCGAYVSWGVVTPVVMMETVASLYRLPHARFAVDVVYTNNAVTGAMRGFGNPQSTFFVEVGMDRAAEAIGMDPLEFRLKNVNRPFEETPQGLKITSCGLRECLIEIGEAIDWSKRERPQEEGGRLSSAPSSVGDAPGVQATLRRGIGVASTLNVGGGARIYRSDGCGATVKVDDFGRVTLVTGATEIGQGSDVVLAQVVAEVLGVDVRDVDVVNDDTNIKLWDVGTHASRTTFIAGKAAWLAAQDAKSQILAYAAALLDVPVDKLEMKERAVVVKDAPDKSLSLDRVVRKMHFRQGGEVVLGQGWYDPDTRLVDKDTYKGNISAAYGFGAHAAEVEVDVETGQVRVLRIVAAHDVGRAINPMYVEGQVEGGIHMGLGYALLEEIQMEEGRILNPNFHDYRLATSMDMPEIETIIVETEDPEGPFGAKGVGEMGGNPVAAAIANAIYNAVGVRINSLPITAEKVLRALDALEQADSR